MEQQEKPFKTIEVVDSRTGQLCKIACMSCIRGHRTTSCGIPVCRQKVFWTVKRPGRPSNSCTCRYSASGRCKCAVVKTACPHRPKKGEKRTVDCRCDEQGRYCCHLDPEHWEQLLSLANPRVDFYPNRQALEASQRGFPQRGFPQLALPPTPSHSVASPQTLSGLDTSATASQPNLSPVQVNDFSSPSVSRARFGMMGVGGPMGGPTAPSRDVLQWQGQAPQAPREYQPYGAPPEPQTPIDSVPQSPASTNQAPPTPFPYVAPNRLSQSDFLPPITQSMQTMTMSQQSSAPIISVHTDKLTADYFNYQFPSAICQSCGLNGCTCRSCPPVMQNFGNGSWANCCSRKHTRPPAQTRTVPVAATQASASGESMALAPSHTSNGLINPLQDQHQGLTNGAMHDPSTGEKFIPSLDSDSSFTPEFNMDEFRMITEGSESMDLSDLLMDDFHPQDGDDAAVGGCCCGGTR